MRQLLWEEEVASLRALAPSLPQAARTLLRATLESIVSEQTCERALVEAAVPLLAELEPNLRPGGAPDRGRSEQRTAVGRAQAQRVLVA